MESLKRNGTGKGHKGRGTHSVCMVVKAARPVVVGGCTGERVAAVSRKTMAGRGWEVRVEKRVRRTRVSSWVDGIREEGVRIRKSWCWVGLDGRERARSCVVRVVSRS